MPLHRASKAGPKQRVYDNLARPEHSSGVAASYGPFHCFSGVESITLKPT